jgi:hypothetical protein
MPSFGAAKNTKKRAKELSHMEIRKAENGGASVMHHFTSMEHQPEMHVFGAGEGKEVAAHVMHHMGMGGTENAETTHDIDMAEGSDKAEIDD